MNEKEKKLKKILKEIEECNDGKHDNKIIKLCDEGLKIDNKNPQLYFYKGNSLSQLALYHNNSNKYLEAISNFNIALDIDKNNKAPLYNRGLCYYSLALNENNNAEYLNKAIDDFNNLINFLKEFEKNIKNENYIMELNRKYDEIYSIRALSYVYFNKYDKALNDFNISIKYNSECGGYYYNRGICYYNISIKNNNDINYLKSAIEDFDKAKELGFNSSDIYFYNGLSYLNLGSIKSENYTEYLNNAINNFDFSIKVDNDNKVEAYYRKGLAYMYLALYSNNNIEYFEKSLENFNIAIDYNSTNGEYYYNRAGCYYNLGFINENINVNNFKLSINDYNKAIELGFNDYQIYNNIGLAYISLGLFDNDNSYFEMALINFIEYVKFYKENPDVYYRIGISLNRLGKYEESLENFDKAISLNINDEFLYYYIFSSNFSLQNYEIAIENINNFIELNPDSEVGYYNRGLCYVNLALKKDENYNKYYEMFENDFNKAIELKSDDEFMISKMGGFYYILGDYNKCLNQFNKVIEINKENDFAYYYRGLCYFYLKNYNEAVKNYDISEKYCKSYQNKLSIYDRKIEILLKLENRENEIYNLYKNVILELYKQISNDSIFYTYDLFNILSSITRNLLYIKNKIDIDENDIINNNKQIINKAIQDDFYNQQFYYEIKNDSLYNYTKVNKDTLRSVLNNTLWCSNTKNFNDPVDPFIKKNSYDKSYDYLLERIKVACLTTHNDNTLMWSHYADKHQGICIEYDINNIFDKNNIILKKISYNKKAIRFDLIKNTQNTIMLSNTKNIDNFLISPNFISNALIDNNPLDHITELFMVKSKEWEYEDEYRILFYDEENKNPNGALINLPIKSICLGVQTSKEDKELVYNLVKSINEKNRNKNGKKYRRIKLYYAELDDNELFKINIKPYKHEKN
ncbi:tetratricopeptide repeat protein [uncultured Brachyspira sp.]|uniref:tetratricopeptide repeat protein n=1 Tax=uncultured Brachyspira sp. TaxID=221953 RepID=UPI00262F61EE|nr:tetratricopeptide repeat protein [uncultured Brachyspira sp.]